MDLILRSSFNTFSLGFVLILAFWQPNLAAQGINGSPDANYYTTITEDGAWCWFSDPRAVKLNDKVYAGWVSSDGSVFVASYNEKTQETKHVNLYPQYNKDDHANPSLLILPDNRIMVFFTAHSRAGRDESVEGINYLTSKNPEDITEWQSPQKISENVSGNKGFCYTNPIMLSEEDNRIYMFWRGGNFKPTFCYTDDLGKTWSKVFTLIESKREITKRPYVKISGNGKDEIHFAFTDGHPRNEPFNSIYYVKYKKGKFFKADGSLLGDMNSLPLKHESCDIVYDAKKYFEEKAFGIPSWIWDVAVDDDGQPSIVYARLPTESEHRYWYSKWNGSEWVTTKIANAGAWFPRYKKTKGLREPEPHYSGGVYLDHENTDIVYYSRPVEDVFEIFSADINNSLKGVISAETAITVQSKKDNVRPFAIRGADESSASQLMWMYNNNYSDYEHYDSEIKINILKSKPSAELTKSAIKTAMKRVADWQLKEALIHPTGDWTNAALYAGMVEWGKMADDSTYLHYLLMKGNELQWARLLRTEPSLRYFADDYATGQMFVEMSRIYSDKSMITPTESFFDFILENPSTRSLKFSWDKGSYPTERWSWCDALFMGPTVWAKMANELDRKDYLAFMHQEYVFSYDYLYSDQEHLFYRDDRYFEKKEANGENVYWGRGNGWVIGGLPTILEEVPEDWEHKIFYEKLFIEMATKVASLQGEDGYWHASLLDPASYPTPETSCSAFFTYALAWGINNGYLAKSDFQPVVEKGWKALIKAVYPDGKLGWVQPVGKDPKAVTEEMTEVYGVGAFLLAGTEVYKMFE